MPDIRVVPAHAVHIKPIAQHMAHWDRIEAEAFGLVPRRALQRGVIGSTHCWTALVDGAPVAMFGCTPVSPWEATIWLLGTDEARRHARAFFEIGGAAVAIMLGTYDRLSNYVARGNVAAVRTLAHWGFTIGGAETLIGETSFLPFWIERPK